jgi:hypothetical protein
VCIASWDPDGTKELFFYPSSAAVGKRRELLAYENICLMPIGANCLQDAISVLTTNVRML